MKLVIDNIARVERADIEMQGITVVAGDNATGKSTVSKSLYAILEMSNNAILRAEMQKKRSFRTCIVSWKRRYVPIADISGKFFCEEVERYYDKAEGNLSCFLDAMLGFIKENMPDKFWDINKMQREIVRLFNTCSEIAGRDLNYYCQYISNTILADVFQRQINCLKNRAEGSISYIKEDTKTKIRVQNHKIVHMDLIYDAVSAQPVYITTPDLMDSMETYKKLYSAERFRTISYANSQLTKLLMEEQDPKRFVAEEYNRIEEQKQQLQKLFSEVLEGEIQLDERRLVYYDKWCEGNIELSNIASGMKIFLILQNLVANGTFLEHTCLIIDEPETNLHPEWQLKLAQLLVLLNVKLDIQIYVNSHSPYFVRAIEYYANQYQMLEQCNFYIMKKDAVTGMCISENVSDNLGVIYDKMAEPFNLIM
ncbi:MAG: ATP-binding protein [Lachnospiraceae bacterium]|nr:ATP-binding protein [Lachnospiraceae bacterium]